MIEADDAIDTAALRYPRDPKRRYRPFALCVGFVAPHFPFVVPEPYFSRYYPHNVDMPGDPPGHLDNLPPAANRLREAFGFHGYSDDDIARARAAYYGLITYLDDKIRRTAKGSAVLQLCFCSDLLGSVQGTVPARMWLALGGSEAQKIPFRVDDYSAYYRLVVRDFKASRSKRCAAKPVLAAASYYDGGDGGESLVGRWAIDAHLLEVDVADVKDREVVYHWWLPLDQKMQISLDETKSFLGTRGI